MHSLRIGSVFILMIIITKKKKNKVIHGQPLDRLLYPSLCPLTQIDTIYILKELTMSIKEAKRCIKCIQCFEVLKNLNRWWKWWVHRRLKTARKKRKISGDLLWALVNRQNIDLEIADSNAYKSQLNIEK